MLCPAIACKAFVSQHLRHPLGPKQRMLMLRAGGAEAVRSWGPARMLSRGCFPRRTAMTVASSMRNGDAQTNPLLAPLVQREVVPQALSTASPSTSGPTSSVAACTLLVAGTAVGAGMLALPTVTAPVGFAAAGPTLVGACVYSLITGLLVAEVRMAASGRAHGPVDAVCAFLQALLAKQP